MTIREGTIAADPISSVFSSPDPPPPHPTDDFIANQIVATCAIIARMKSSVKVTRHMRDCGKTFGGWSALAFDLSRRNSQWGCPTLCGFQRVGTYAACFAQVFHPFALQLDAPKI